jgi:hypothetical protein
MYSLDCNPKFIEQVTELGYPIELDKLKDKDAEYVDDEVFRKFRPADSTQCAAKKCTEYKYMMYTLTR